MWTSPSETSMSSSPAGSHASSRRPRGMTAAFTRAPSATERISRPPSLQQATRAPSSLKAIVPAGAAMPCARGVHDPVATSRSQTLPSAAMARKAGEGPSRPTTANARGRPRGNASRRVAHPRLGPKRTTLSPMVATSEPSDLKAANHPGSWLSVPWLARGASPRPPCDGIPSSCTRPPRVATASRSRVGEKSIDQTSLPVSALMTGSPDAASTTVTRPEASPTASCAPSRESATATERDASGASHARSARTGAPFSGTSKAARVNDPAATNARPSPVHASERAMPFAAALGDDATVPSARSIVERTPGDESTRSRPSSRETASPRTSAPSSAIGRASSVGGHDAGSAPSAVRSISTIAPCQSPA